MSVLLDELLVADGEDRSAGWSALQALEPRFELSASGPEVVRRTWLDTFDWRLHRAGLTLEHGIAGARSWLTLTADTGEQLSSGADGVSWPSVVDDLPASPLRDRLDRVAGIRALLPMAEAQSSVQQIRVLNHDAKTVARIVLDRPTRRGRPHALAHVSVAPVRGYEKDGARIVEVLRGQPGVEASTTSVFEQALASAGRVPESYSSKVDVPLDPSMSAVAAVSTVLRTFCATLEANVSGVIEDIDTEFLHDLRVAVRRTRSVLKLAGDVLPGSMAERFAPEFKRLGDITTPMRDLDVFLLGFDTRAGELLAAEAADLEPFRAHLARRREAERRRLIRRLRSPRFRSLLVDWRAALDAALGSGADASGDLSTAKELAEQRVSRAYRRVVKHGAAITPDSPAEQLHTLRKRCKELRYLLEIFSSLQDPAAHRRVVRELKDLQECLGDFQDSQVQREAVSELAAQMTSEGAVPSAAILAMGELASQLEAHQRWARNDYAGRFERFMRPKNRLAFAQLTGTKMP
ncbi:MAG: CHAD domain-containing protein [Actinomycetota bacterium]|nr:CHAD domain-containing protein [Actinomycetota bacterium]